MSDCLSVLAANDFLSKDENRITGRIARSLAINSPWINLIETSTFRSGVSDTQRSVRQEAVAPVLSQAQPNWSTFACTKTPTDIQTGSTEFQYTPLSHLERGPKICVTQAFSSFKNAIRQTEMSITDHVQTLWNSWIRYQMYLNSGTKATVASGLSLANMVSSGFGTSFPLGITPNAGINFRFLKALANHLTHSLLAGSEFQFGSGMQKHFRFISDQETLDSLRAQADVRSDLRHIASGGFAKEGKDALLNYCYEGPYQGIAFGVDQSITRASAFDPVTGTPTFVEPFSSEVATKGVRRIANPDWLAAPYQISYLVAKNSFIREIPEEFLGEGLTRFDRQFWGGKIVWHNQKDNGCNIKGDTGFHYYDLAAAMRPERPEFVIPIIHTRCTDDLGLVGCTPQGYYSNSL
jgi:hypothetical protein